MKNSLCKLKAVAVVLTMLVPSLTMALTGCGPEMEVTPTTTPVPSPTPKATSTQAELPPTASSPLPDRSTTLLSTNLGLAIPTTAFI